MKVPKNKPKSIASCVLCSHASSYRLPTKKLPSRSTIQSRPIDIIVVQRHFASRDSIMSKYPNLKKQSSEIKPEKSQDNNEQIRALEMEQITKILGTKFIPQTKTQLPQEKPTSTIAKQRKGDFAMDPSLLSEPSVKAKFGNLAALLPKTQPEDPRSLNVALIGAPNAGKSTLVNRLVGEDVSITSKRVQTTRDQVIGVVTRKNVQVVFLDTPGIISWELEASVQRKIVTAAWNTLVSADCGLLVVDGKTGLDAKVQEILLKMKRLRAEVGEHQRPYALVVNKEDLVPSKADLRLVVDLLLDSKIFSEYFTVSALNNTGIDDLRDYLMMKSVERPWSFSAETKTNQSDLNKVTEIIRQELYKRLYYELPYVLEQRNFAWSELPGGVLRIDQDVLVPKGSQMKTVIGKAGSIINEVRFAAAQEIQKQLKREIQLFISVRTKEKTSRQA